MSETVAEIENKETPSGGGKTDSAPRKKSESREVETVPGPVLKTEQSPKAASPIAGDVADDVQYKPGGDTSAPSEQPQNEGYQTARKDVDSKLSSFREINVGDKFNRMNESRNEDKSSFAVLNLKSNSTEGKVTPNHTT